MKKVLFVFICLSIAVSAQYKWKVALKPSMFELTDVSFINSETGWGSADSGYVYQTIDGGNTWKSFKTPVDVTLTNVQFLNDEVVFAAGDSILLKTTDRGISWKILNSPPAELFDSLNMVVKSIQFFDEMSGYLLITSTKAGRLFYTSDGGDNWIQKIDNPYGDLEGMNFLSKSTGIVVGGGSKRIDIYFTKDGENFIPAPIDSIRYDRDINYSRMDLKSVYLVDSNVAYASGWGNTVGLQPSIILKTTNGGSFWFQYTQKPDKRTYVNLYSIWFENEKKGFAAGGDNSQFGSVLLKTEDGGLNWDRVPVNGQKLLKFISTGDKSYILGENCLQYSLDRIHWESILKSTWNTINTFQSVDEYKFFAGGYGGIILQSNDSGNNWNFSYASDGYSTSAINDLHFITKDIGYAAKDYKTVSKTTDGGKSWIHLMQDLSSANNSNEGIFFQNELNGFVVGKAGLNNDIIYKTTDGGANWLETTGIFNAQLNNIAFADQNRGVVVGNKSSIGYTTDCGLTWQKSTLINVPDGKLFNINDVLLTNDNGFAVGVNCIFKTNDAGISWTFQIVDSIKATLQVVKSYGNIICAAGDRKILLSNNFGETWKNITDSSVIESNINSICFDSNGNIWAAGEDGIIYTSTDSLTNIEEIYTNIPSEFKLEQNYPNPFNPVTTISYTVEHQNKVELTIYDILGSTITKLVDEVKTPGTYNVTFNSDKFNLSSGIYFYRIESGKSIAVKKMCYLK